MDERKFESDIKEFIKAKMGGRTYMISVLYSDQNEPNKRTDGMKELKVIFSSNLDPTKRTYAEIYSYIQGITQVLTNIRDELTPTMPKIKLD